MSVTLARVFDWIAYQGFLRELREANPGARLTIDAANSHVSAGAQYKALRKSGNW